MVSITVHWFNLSHICWQDNSLIYTWQLCSQVTYKTILMHTSIHVLSWITSSDRPNPTQYTLNKICLNMFSMSPVTVNCSTSLTLMSLFNHLQNINHLPAIWSWPNWKIYYIPFILGHSLEKTNIIDLLSAYCQLTSHIMYNISGCSTLLKLTQLIVS